MGHGKMASTITVVISYCFLLPILIFILIFGLALGIMILSPSIGVQTGCDSSNCVSTIRALGMAPPYYKEPRLKRKKRREPRV